MMNSERVNWDRFFCEKFMKRGFTALKSYFDRETDTSQQATYNAQGSHSSVF